MIPYILHVALLISVCLLFYKLLLQKETFYRLNRMILVCCLALAFVLPLIPIPAQWSFQAATKQAEVNYKPVDVQQQAVVSPESHTVAAPPVPAPPQVSRPVITTQAQATPAPVENIQKPVEQAALSTPILPVVLKWLFFLYWMGVAAFGLNLLLQFSRLTPSRLSGMESSASSS